MKQNAPTKLVLFKLRNNQDYEHCRAATKALIYSEGPLGAPEKGKRKSAIFRNVVIGESRDQQFIPECTKFFFCLSFRNRRNRGAHQLLFSCSGSTDRGYSGNTRLCGLQIGHRWYVSMLQSFETFVERVLSIVNQVSSSTS